MFHRILGAYFAFFTVFWFLGVDQLYFMLLCLAGFMAHMTSQRTSYNVETFLFAGFVLVTFASAIQITTGYRYITYLRNEGVYMAMFFILLSSTFVAVRKPDSTDKFYLILLLFSIQCTVFAFLASNGLGITFKSLAAYLVPDFGSKYIQTMLNKSSVQSEASWFSEGFARPRGVMLYANTMAGVLCATMAIKAYFFIKFWSDKRAFLALICIVAILMDFFSVYSALSRSTWLGLAFALLVFPFAFKTSVPAKFLPGLVAVLAVGLVFATGLNEGIQARLTDKGHSNEGRGLNYVLIWEMTTSSIDTFLIGHGTQLDHPDLTIPVGSHSTYLGMFFKFGFLGMTFFMLFLFALYRRMLSLTKDVYALNNRGYTIIRPYFVCFGLIVLLVQMTFIEVDVDAAYALFVAVLMFLVIQESEAVKALLAQEHALTKGQSPEVERIGNPARFPDGLKEP